MDEHRNRPAALLSLLPWLPWLALLASLGTTWLVWDHERNSANNEMRSQFNFALRETVSRIEQRVAAYEQMLRGVQSLLATTSLKNRKGIHDYVESLQLDANFSGVQVIGVVELVAAQDKTRHEAAMRQLGLADYRIEPAGEREIYAPVIQREPFFGRNRNHLGFDAWSEPRRQEAMIRARDSGMAAISGKVRLAVDDASTATPGFIMYLPVFAHDQPHDNLAQRRAHLVGWVFASFHMNDFMASLYGRQPSGLALSIYDEVDPTEAALIYRSTDGNEKPEPAGKNTLSTIEYMVVAGHNWTVSLSTQQQFEKLYDRDTAFVIAAAGTCLSFALAALVWLLLNGRSRALRLAARMTEKLRHMAQHDLLTGLPNRALFSDRLQQELARAKRQNGQFALIFLDLDHFKPINDNFGHAVGDQLLLEMAQRLRTTVRAADTVGRIGGDEFVILMTELTDASDALSLAEKICEAVRQPVTVNGVEQRVSCSLGIAIYPTDGIDEITLTKRADAAMYRTKENGRDGIELAGRMTNSRF